MRRSVIVFSALVTALLTPPVAAQDTARGVRIGLRYDPGTKPGVLVLPVGGGGAGADSIKAILERDFDYSDRLAVVRLASTDGALSEPSREGGGAGTARTLNYPVLGKLGAAAVVQVTPTASGLHVALHDVTAAAVARVHDVQVKAEFPGRDWRQVIHGLADEVEEWITGRRGIAQTRIAFVRGGTIRFVDSDGQEERPLQMTGEALSPAWHPGGQMLAYSTFGIDSRIVLHDLRTGRVREFGAQRNTTNLTPVFTPDGKSVAYSLSSEQGADLYLLALDGQSFPRRVTVGRGSQNVGPSYSPDGNRVTFTSDRTGHPEVYIMDADGTNADIFTAFDFGDQNDRASPDWSPDGRQIAFQSRIDGRFQIFTMSIRDRQPRQLTSEGENEDPSWAPDGRHLVFVSTRTGTQQLWILDTESGRLRQVTRLGGARLPAWSPRLSGGPSQQ